MSDTSTELDEQILSDLDAELEMSRPWSVIVWNDPINMMEFVTYVFQTVFGYSKSKSESLMLDVHHKGRANVFSGERTEAERYVHKLHTFGLWATMEKDE